MRWGTTGCVVLARWLAPRMAAGRDVHAVMRVGCRSAKWSTALSTLKALRAATAVRRQSRAGAS
jgi:hypothetical protein